MMVVVSHIFEDWSCALLKTFHKDERFTERRDPNNHNLYSCGGTLSSDNYSTYEDERFTKARKDPNEHNDGTRRSSSSNKDKRVSFVVATATNPERRRKKHHQQQHFHQQHWFRTLARLTKSKKSILRKCKGVGGKEWQQHEKMMLVMLNDLIRLTVQRMMMSSGISHAELVHKVMMMSASSSWTSQDKYYPYRTNIKREMINCLFEIYRHEVQISRCVISIFRLDVRSVQKEDYRLKRCGVLVRPKENKSKGHTRNYDLHDFNSQPCLISKLQHDVELVSGGEKDISNVQDALSRLRNRRRGLARDGGTFYSTSSFVTTVAAFGGEADNSSRLSMWGGNNLLHMVTMQERQQDEPLRVHGTSGRQRRRILGASGKADYQGRFMLDDQ